MIQLFHGATSREAVLGRLNIERGDLVLDVGSGSDPHPRADLLCDKYMLENDQRAGELVATAPLVIGDAEELPFRSKSFDFVVASHILEHLPHPERCLHELARVAPAGYIETPTELRERMFGWSFHRWIVRVEDGVLTFYPNDYRRLWGNTFYRIAAERRLLAHFYERCYDLFNLMVEWRDTISFRVQAEPIPFEPGAEPSPSEEEKRAKGRPRDGAAERWSDFSYGLGRLMPAGKAVGRARRAWHLRRTRASAFPRRLLATLACPRCKGAVRSEGERLICDQCRLAYPVVAGVPHLVAGESKDVNPND